jgi:ABC-type cobalt transport system substrate-binding protein
METMTERSADDIATPIPKVGGFEPSVTIVGLASTDFIAEAQAVEGADSKPLVLASQILPSQISPVAPLAPIETILLEVNMPAVFVEAGAKMTPTDSQTSRRVATPLPGTRPVVEPVFEPPPLATTSNDEPRMNVVMDPTRGFTPVARNVESVAGKPMILASQIFPSQVSPVNPSEPVESSQIEIKMPSVLVESEAKLIPADTQTSQRVATPLPGTRPAVKPVFEPPPLATESNDEPRMNVVMVPTRGFIPVARNGESITGKALILVSQVSPLQFAPADPSLPPMSSPLDVRIPAIPIEAKSALISAYPQSPQKIEIPLASQQPRKNFAAEHQPIPKEDAYEPVLMVSTLQVQSQPNGAQVYVNGMLIGETPLARELPLGKHEVRIALPDYYQWDAQVELTSDHKMLPIIYRLVPIDETQ